MDKQKRMADLIYESAMLKRTPRSGFAFLGSGRESVAEHSYGTAFIGMILASIAGADLAKTIQMCLLHDLHEAATGDFNYVNHRYDKCDARAALEDALAGTGFASLFLPVWEEFEARSTTEAILANDADQLDMICSLRAQLVAGNQFAAEWLDTAVKRIRSEEGQRICEAIMTTDPAAWWYDQVDKSWWIDRNRSKKD